MSGAARPSVSSLLRSLENDVDDVGRWGQLLVALAPGSDNVDDRVLYVVGDQLRELGDRLREGYGALLKATGGER